MVGRSTTPGSPHPSPDLALAASGDHGTALASAGSYHHVRWIDFLTQTVSGSDTRALSRVVGLLIAASVVRYGLALRRPPVTLSAEDASALPGLLEESRAGRREDSLRSRPLDPGERIDPNRASAAELDRLPGVGPSLAAALIREREEGGAFASVKDLERVPGIGSATAGRLRSYLDLPDPPLVSGGRVRSSGRSSSRGSEEMSGGQGRRIDLNLASAEEMQTLPGIGPALAARIVELRRQRGGFRSVDELLEVRGIGTAILRRLRPLVVVGGAGL